MAEWLGRWTCNPEVPGSSPFISDQLDLFHGGSLIKSSATLTKSQVLSLPAFGVFKMSLSLLFSLL